MGPACGCIGGLRCPTCPTVQRPTWGLEPSVRVCAYARVFIVNRLYRFDRLDIGPSDRHFHAVQPLSNLFSLPQGLDTRPPRAIGHHSPGRQPLSPQAGCLQGEEQPSQPPHPRQPSCRCLRDASYGRTRPGPSCRSSPGHTFCPRLQASSYRKAERRQPPRHLPVWRATLSPVPRQPIVPLRQQIPQLSLVPALQHLQNFPLPPSVRRPLTRPNRPRPINYAGRGPDPPGVEGISLLCRWFGSVCAGCGSALYPVWTTGALHRAALREWKAARQLCSRKDVLQSASTWHPSDPFPGADFAPLATVLATATRQGRGGEVRRGRTMQAPSRRKPRAAMPGTILRRANTPAVAYVLAVGRAGLPE
jgi:hypothetical protein